MLVLVFASALAFAAEPLTVQVKGLTTTEGTVICTLYDAPEHWLKKVGSVVSVKVPAVNGGATCTFPDVAPGTYAASFIHDVDNDGDMNTNWLGLPREPWGVSRDAPMRYGPPAFEEAAFTHPGATVVATAK